MTTVNEKVFDPTTCRADFPILDQTIHRDRPLIYFDNGASTQRPQDVVNVMTDCYQRTYANVHRGIHWLSEQSSAQYESARKTVRRFINASHYNEIIFTSGTTASINLVARAWGDANVQAGDEILLTLMEHHSNIVPWQQLAERTGASVKWAGITSTGELDWEDFEEKLSDKTKIVSFSAVSNVMGTKTPPDKIAEKARRHGALVLVDAAQHTPHEPTDVQAWDADFVAFSGHKMLGPSGVGILYGRQSLLESMPPFLGGGSMISRVTTDGFSPGELPAKFEAGTPPIVETVGLEAAINYLDQVGLDRISEHETRLAAIAIEELEKIDGLTVLGPSADKRAGLVSFAVESVSPQDIAILLDQQGIAIRAGHHCAMPLHQHLGIRASCRASFYLYNTVDEVQQFVETLEKVVGRLR